MQTPAPSENWLALPAEITPPSMAGLIFDTPSWVVSARMPSSCATLTSFIDSAPVALSTTFMVVFIGAISSLNLPASRAAPARCWLRTPYRSCCSREIPYFFATYSAVCSIGQYNSGLWVRIQSSFSMCLFISFWTHEMDSTPPAA